MDPSPHYHTPLLATHLTSPRFKCQLNWPLVTSMYRGVFTGVWRDLELVSLVRVYTICIFINCSYGRVLSEPYPLEYTTNVTNYGPNNPKKYEKISFISIALTKHHRNYWHANPMTIDDLCNFCLCFIGHNMIVGSTLGPWA